MFVCFFLLVVSVSAFAEQSSWLWRNPLPTGAALSAATFSGKDRAFAVGSGGTMIETRDTGLTWQTRLLYTYSWLRDIDFPRADRGYCAGDSGIIFFTTDSGSSWRRQASGTMENLFGLHFVDTNFGWACGTNGTVIHTTDGGISWKMQTVADELTGKSCSYLVFTDRMNGWVTSSDGYLMRTLDGGVNWTSLGKVFTGTITIVTGMDFVSPTNGFATYFSITIPPPIPPPFPGKAVKTIDGGATWADNPIGVTTFFSALDFVNESHGCLLGSNGLIVQTDDGGVSWSQQSVPATTALNGVDFQHDTSGIIVGLNGVILRTKTSGGEWDLRTKDITGGKAVNKISFVDSMNGWMCGSSGLMLHTTDGGTTFTQQTVGTTEKLNSVAFTSPTNGWTVGTAGAVYKTANRGALWNAVSVPGINVQTAYESRDVRFVSQTTGWIVTSGDAGLRVFKTTNGGVDWITQQLTSAAVPKKIFMLDSLVGWIAASDGEIFKTTTGGTLWENIKTGAPAGVTVKDIFFADTSYGWCVTSTGEIYKSIDKGSTWTAQFDGAAALNAVHGVNRSIGWVVDTTGKIFSTTNGGTTWVNEPASVTSSLNDIFPLTTKNVFTAGNFGSILFTTNSGAPFIEPAIGEVELAVEFIDYKGRAIPGQYDTVVTVKNIGNAPLNVTATAFNAGVQYSVVAGGAPFSLAPDLSRSVTVRYKPLTVGVHRDTLSVVSDGVITIRKIYFMGRADSTLDVREARGERSHIEIANYPNPFYTATTFRIEGARENSKVSVKIFDMLGEEIVARSFYGNSFTLDAGSFTTGVYLCRIQVDDAFFSHTITVIR